MYGCYDGVLIYGILDENRDRTANRDFLEAHGVSHFAADVVKNYCGNSIYGVALSLSDILDKSKDYRKAEKTLAAFAKVLKKACPDDWPEPDCHVGVTGDYSSCATITIRGA